MDGRRWANASTAIDLAVSVGCLALIVLSVAIIVGYDPSEIPAWWMPRPERPGQPDPAEVAMFDQVRREISWMEHGYGSGD